MIIFILANFGLVGAIYYIIVEGDLNRLSHGSDFRGNVCGISKLSSKPYTYFPSPEDTQIVLCITSCPSSIIHSSVCYYDTDGITSLPI